MTVWSALVAPDRDDAREWAERELSDPRYEAAEPTVFDRVAHAIAEFLASILSVPDASGALSPFAIVVVLVVVAALIVVAFLIWGRPRLDRGRRSDASADVLAGDERSSAELRADSAAQAARGDWNAAVVLRFRALARSLDERGLVHVPPGTTAQGLARSATAFFPAQSEAIVDAARIFDDVRYLRRAATEELLASVASVDDAVAAAVPARAPEAVPA